MPEIGELVSRLLAAATQLEATALTLRQVATELQPPAPLIDDRQQRIAALSREHDTLAHCALVLWSREQQAWYALSDEAKITAILYASDAWAREREFVETHL